MKILKLGKYQGRLIQQLNNTFKDVGFLISLLCPFHCCLFASLHDCKAAATLAAKHL